MTSQIHEASSKVLLCKIIFMKAFLPRKHWVSTCKFFYKTFFFLPENKTQLYFSDNRFIKLNICFIYLFWSHLHVVKVKRTLRQIKVKKTLYLLCLTVNNKHMIISHSSSGRLFTCNWEQLLSQPLQTFIFIFLLFLTQKTKFKIILIIIISFSWMNSSTSWCQLWDEERWTLCL